MHQRVSGPKQYKATRGLLREMNRWLEKLRDANGRAGAYPEPAFTRVLGMRWFYLCLISPELGMWRWTNYLSSSLGKFKLMDWRFEVASAVSARFRKSR